MPYPAGDGQVLQAQGLRWGVNNDAVYFNDDGAFVADTSLGFITKGPAPWVDAKAYGAAGQNDIRDDTGKIQNAIIAGVNSKPAGRARVYLPAGHYRITAPLVWTSNYLTLEGAGALQTVLHVMSGASFSAAIYVDQSSQYPIIRNLGVQFDAGTPSASGIVFNGANGIRMEHVVVQGAPGDGIRMEGSVQGFQHYMNDVYVLQCGHDGVFVGSQSFDADFHTVVVNGANVLGSTAGHNGITNYGGETHLIDCHPYFMANDGLFVGGGNVSVVGGEYESCNIGVELASTTAVTNRVQNASMYQNATDVLAATNNAMIEGNSLTSEGVRNILGTNSVGVAIKNNSLLNATYSSVELDGSCNAWHIEGNTVHGQLGGSASFRISGARNTYIHGNMVLSSSTYAAQPVVEGSGSNFSRVYFNHLAGAGVTTVGGSTVASFNF